MMTGIAQVGGDARKCLWGLDPLSRYLIVRGVIPRPRVQTGQHRVERFRDRRPHDAITSCKQPLGVGGFPFIYPHSGDGGQRTRREDASADRDVASAIERLSTRLVTSAGGEPQASLSSLKRIAVRGSRIGDARILRRRKGLAVDPLGHAIHAEEQRHGHRHPRDPDHEDDEPPSHEGFDPSRSSPGWPACASAVAVAVGCLHLPRSPLDSSILVRLIAARPTGRNRPRAAPGSGAPPPARSGGSPGSGTRS
jgi:hypothetical protein